MSKKPVYPYKKDGKDFIRIEKKNKEGNIIWQKEIPRDKELTDSGAHFIYGRDDQFHYDIYHNDGTKEIEYQNPLIIGSTAIESGQTIFNKSPEQEFHIMPIRDTPKIIETEDTGNTFKIKVEKAGKIIYSITEKKS